MSSSCLFALFLFFAFSLIAQAVVPDSETFKFVNEGEFGDYIVEYGVNYRVLSISSTPFQLCFYNTTPGAYTLSLRMGTVRSESLMRWVWEANRGSPVGENATFSLGTDGNLLLANANGHIAWQSMTVNKGVVGFKLLPNGNMVLYDSKGNFVWQSFDSPTDTLLVGQSLRVGGPNKLVGRVSEKENKDGPYSLVLEPKRFAMYYKSNNAQAPMIYFDSADYLSTGNNTLNSLKFASDPETREAYAYELKLEYPNGGARILSRPKYNSTLTYLRLGIDGTLKAYTFYDKVDYSAWEVTFTLFSRDSGDECQLPERCGKFGLCEDSQCVACPFPNGLMGWSKNCEPPKITSCKAKDIKFYKLEGVDHFITKYTRGNGPISGGQCSNKCTTDCKCVGYFYHQTDSRCWIVYDLKTLTKVANSTHLGYMKAPIV
ncbi:epidermis-specific secreted glycoprotein EP1-like [Olea europaea var. sylvestris]|uniref:epidermis-specific secreted glycoprotein EP1-like n=1 Tax=Olea europaea var. sylvestris TaxID=158386 RepID=UPI000C1D2F44|nr:epidermis-specific secreted glycoprotein EP1-like [Olea europaea var. sylvestris]